MRTIKVNEKKVSGVVIQSTNKDVMGQPVWVLGTERDMTWIELKSNSRMFWIGSEHIAVG